MLACLGKSDFSFPFNEGEICGRNYRIA